MPKSYSYDFRQKVIDAIELDGYKKCQVLYLPPYSPDLNRIEKCWSWLKSRIRHCLSEFDCLRDAMEHILKLSS